jgi:hypothetical protein
MTAFVFETETFALHDILSPLFETGAFEEVFEDELAPVSLCF